MQHEANHNNRLPVLSHKREVTVQGNKATVSEMSWPDTFEFLKQLSTHAGKLTDEKGSFKFDLTKLTDIVINTRELSEHLILHSTDPLPVMKDLSFVEGLELLDAALEMNLSEELVAKAKNVGARFGRALGIKFGVKITKTLSSEPSTSSSGKAMT